MAQGVSHKQNPISSSSVRNVSGPFLCKIIPSSRLRKVFDVFLLLLLISLLADDVGIKVLFKRLRRDNIKDISHKKGNLEYTLYK